MSKKIFGYSTLALAVVSVGLTSAFSQAGGQIEPLKTQDLKPMSAADHGKVTELLKSFDPNSYSFDYSYKDAKGKLVKVHAGGAKGLAQLRQSNTVRATGANGKVIPAGSKAATNMFINIFKQASTNTTINIFKQASSNTTINIFKQGDQQNKANQLNGILKSYFVEK